jgi:hypothetical protein
MPLPSQVRALPAVHVVSTCAQAIRRLGGTGNVRRTAKGRYIRAKKNPGGGDDDDGLDVSRVPKIRAYPLRASASSIDHGTALTLTDHGNETILLRKLVHTGMGTTVTAPATSRHNSKCTESTSWFVAQPFADILMGRQRRKLCVPCYHNTGECVDSGCVK